MYVHVLVLEICLIANNAFNAAIHVIRVEKNLHVQDDKYKYNPF